MSTRTERTLDWRDDLHAVYFGGLSESQALAAGMTNLHERIFVLRAIGVDIDLREGRYTVSRSDSNLRWVVILLEARARYGR